MDFEWDAQQQALQKEVQDFIAKEVNIEELDEEEGEGARSPKTQAVYDKIHDRGWRAISWPTEYGGQGGSRVDQYLVEEEFARVGLSVGGGGSGGPTILAGGTQEQKDYYIAKLINGEYSFCQGFTEPSGGADLAGLQCRATKDGDDYVINGQKMYTSGAHRGTHIYLMARTDPDSKRNAGISIFLIPMTTPGITVRPLWTIQNEPRAPRGTTYGTYRTNETFFEDVRVPASYILGEVNNGWNLSAMGLNLDRIGAGRYLRSVERDEDIVNWVKDPKNGVVAEHLKNDPSARDRIAECWTEAQVCRLMTLRSMSIVEHDLKFTYEGSAEKVWAPEHGMKVTETIAQLLGPYAQLLNGAEDAIQSGLYAHNMLGAFQSGINHGSTQIMRDQIAQRGLGLPRNR
ncbi:MAG: hypothetical protein DWI58_02175 [Chloroflexi bacterium]|nr:MAG: hypothetical protein DWI58_02175 [Chloroflexota bacterium]